MRLLTRLRVPHGRGDTGGDTDGESGALFDRLDGALAEYRDTTYATWTAPGGPVDVSALGDRRIVTALRAAAPPAPAPSPGASRRRPAVLAATAVAAAVAAIAVAVGAPGERAGVEPEEGVLLAAATPGGDRGPFADGAALRRCLDTARVPEARRTVIGAGPVRLREEAATVLMLPGDALGDLRLIAVTPGCAAGDASSVLVSRHLPGRSAPGGAAPAAHTP